MTVRRTLFRRIRRTGASDRGSLAMVMLVVIVGMGLAALMLPLVLVQTHTTTFDSTRGRALQAAESGIDVAVGAIRAATTNNSNPIVPTGRLAGLPCGPLTGAADTTSKYTATIGYYAEIPTVPDPGAPLPCDPKPGGFFDVANGTPQFALITATGSASNDRARTLVVTYALQQPPFHLFSGQIRTLVNGKWYCITAPYKAPNFTYTGANNAPVSLELCQESLIKVQQFQYKDGLGIQLVDGGACLETDGKPEKSTTLVIKPACSSGGNGGLPVFYNQQIRQVDAPETGISPKCAQADPPNISLTVCTDKIVPTETWTVDLNPSPAWTPANKSQLMNLDSGNCLAVPDGNLAVGYLITYSCMRLPPSDSPVTPWDQAFKTLAVGPSVQFNVKCTVGTDRNCPATGFNGCLTSPEADGGPVYLRAACGGPDQLWNQQATGELENSYTIQDPTGLCLDKGADQTEVPPSSGLSYFKATVAACDGSPRQKWNVPDSARSEVEQGYATSDPLLNLFEN